jgi:hypothetical protein
MISIKYTLGVATIALALISVVAGASVASAKEIGPGAGTTTGTCAPISSLSYKSDIRSGENGPWITVNYSVKPCDARAVRVETALIESSNGFVFFENTDAPLVSKYTLFGVKVATSYQAHVRVYDAQTGELIQSRFVWAGVNRRLP